MTEIKISDEMVEEHAQAVFALEHTGPPLYTWTICPESARVLYRDDARLHLTALVASGWRREADVLREAADRLGSLLTEAMRTGRENSGINAYSGAGQVIDWLERRASEAEQYVSAGTREGEDQKRSEEREHG